MTIVQTILEWIKAAGIIIAAISLYLSYRQLQANLRWIRSNIRWNRINATYSYLPETVYLERERAVQEALKPLDIDVYRRREPITAEQLAKIMDDSNSDAFKQVKDFLNLVVLR